MRKRKGLAGFSLIEILFSVLLISMLFCMVWQVFISGRRILESTKRKVEASMVTHLVFEQMRHDLECAQWTFGGGPPDIYNQNEKKSLVRGSHDLMLGRSAPVPGSLAEVSYQKKYHYQPP